MRNIIVMATICCLAAGGCQPGVPHSSSGGQNHPSNLPQDPIALEEVLPTPSAIPTPSASPKPSSAPSPVPNPNPSTLKPDRPNPLPSAKKEANSARKAPPKLPQHSVTPKSDIFVFHGRTNKKQVALTFDDAPDNQFTPQLLNILQRYRVKATFFVVGYRVAQYPEMLKRIARDGHVVGNHTYHHPQLNKLSSDRFQQEILRNEETIRPIVGYTPKLVRPPYGAITDQELHWLGERHYLVVNWNVDPEDWRGHGKDQIIARATERIHPGSIILLHSATGEGGDLSGTVEALPSIIERLRAEGYQLVTLPELLKVNKHK